MNALLLPYIANILVLVPFGLGALFNLFPVSRGYFPESEGWRTLVGSLWTGIFIGSILGLFWPIVFSPILLLQVIYKTLWLLVYIVPRFIDVERRNEIPWRMTVVFALCAVLYPIVIPWHHLFG